jgi:hypothetical protein
MLEKSILYPAITKGGEMLSLTSMLAVETADIPTSKAILGSIFIGTSSADIFLTFFLKLLLCLR